MAVRTGKEVQFNREAYDKFVRFVQAAQTPWLGNFRDLSAAISRMSTLASGARIAVADVDAEIQRLQSGWGCAHTSEAVSQSPVQLAQTAVTVLQRYLSAGQLAGLDPVEQVELAYVLQVASASRSMAEAGRQLYAVSRLQKSSQNDSARLQKYLASFNLSWQNIRQSEQQ